MSPAISVSGDIYVFSNDNKLYAIKPDGALRWVFQIDLIWGRSSPVIGLDGTIYVGAGSKLFAINPDGSKKWEFETSGVVKFSPAIRNDGVIYLGSGRVLYAVNPDGSMKWEIMLENDVSNSVIIGYENVLYIGVKNYGLYAINPNGSNSLIFKSNAEIKSTPSIASDSTLYFGSMDGKIYVINVDGTKKWEIETNDAISSSAAIGNDGVVYIGSNDRKVYAIYTESDGLADTPWPKLMHDNKNSGRFLFATSIKQEDNNVEVPKEFALFPLYPNPFNPTTNIKFSLPLAIEVEINAYNVRGQLIGRILKEKKNAGIYTLNWDAKNMSSGMYFIQIKAGSFTEIRKCLLIK